MVFASASFIVGMVLSAQSNQSLFNSFVGHRMHPRSRPVVARAAATSDFPTLSILVSTADGQRANAKHALEQIAAQDYPHESIAEIIVDGAQDLLTGAPDSLRSLIKGPSRKGASFSERLSMCSGDILAIWGDDHVSPVDRLRIQVAAAAEESVVTLLQPKWFFDPVEHSVQQVKQWPSFIPDSEDSSETDTGKPMIPVEVMVRSSPLSLCGPRNVITASAALLDEGVSLIEASREMLTNLPAPRILDKLEWLVINSPPDAVTLAEGTPSETLLDTAKRVWPLAQPGKASGKGFALSPISAAVLDIRNNKLGAADAIKMLLTQDVKEKVTSSDQQKVTKLLSQLLVKADGLEMLAAVNALQDWEGLTIGKGEKRHALNFKTFYGVLDAIRDSIKKNADIYEWEPLGGIAESLVKVAMRMWAADPVIMDEVSQNVYKDVYDNKIDSLGLDRRGIDIVGTLGLRNVLEDLAFAALDLSEEEVEVSALASLAWACAEARIDLPKLQSKLARLIMRQPDKLEPPDIGKLYIALDEKDWFTDDKTVEYLVQTLIARVQELKQEDSGIADHIARETVAID